MKAELVKMLFVTLFACIFLHVSSATGENAGCGGVLYTRWGKTTCPPGRELVYKGRVGGNLYTHSGGGANYLCMPDDPEYLNDYLPGVQGHSPVYGAEYQTSNSGPLGNLHDFNVPCAICSVSTRLMVMMIPAKTSCPSSWTLEYVGYLMTEHFSHAHSRMFECMDRDAELIPGSHANTNGALLYHAEATCNGLQCPPYDTNKELACVVCTK